MRPRGSSVAAVHHRSGPSGPSRRRVRCRGARRSSSALGTAPPPPPPRRPAGAGLVNPHASLLLHRADLRPDLLHSLGQHGVGGRRRPRDGARTLVDSFLEVRRPGAVHPAGDGALRRRGHVRCRRRGRRRCRCHLSLSLGFGGLRSHRLRRRRPVRRLGGLPDTGTRVGRRHHRRLVFFVRRGLNLVVVPVTLARHPWHTQGVGHGLYQGTHVEGGHSRLRLRTCRRGRDVLGGALVASFGVGKVAQPRGANEVLVLAMRKSQIVVRSADKHMPAAVPLAPHVVQERRSCPLAAGLGTAKDAIPGLVEHVVRRARALRHHAPQPLRHGFVCRQRGHRAKRAQHTGAASHIVGKPGGDNHRPGEQRPAAAAHLGRRGTAPIACTRRGRAGRRAASRACTGRRLTCRRRSHRGHKPAQQRLHAAHQVAHEPGHRLHAANHVTAHDTGCVVHRAHPAQPRQATHAVHNRLQRPRPHAAAVGVRVQHAPEHAAVRALGPGQVSDRPHRAEKVPRFAQPAAHHGRLPAERVEHVL